MHEFFIIRCQWESLLIAYALGGKMDYAAIQPLENALSIRLNIHVNPAFLGIVMIGKSVFEVPPSDPNKVRKDIAVEFLNLIGLGKPKDGLLFFDPECETHNPYIKGGMEELIDAMIAVQKQAADGIIKGSKADFKLVIRQVLGDGDVVAVHTQLASSKPSEGGLRQVHIFRFRGDKIVEYWDITQMIAEDMPNADGAFS
jgi:predicted SnoaL-like aldol condensation-catalyzing enzyme